MSKSAGAITVCGDSPLVGEYAARPSIQRVLELLTKDTNNDHARHS